MYIKDTHSPGHFSLTLIVMLGSKQKVAMQSTISVLILCTMIAALLAQVEEGPSADKRMRSFAFAKRAVPRAFAFAKRSDGAEEEDDSAMEKRARFAFAKRSPYRQFAFAKRAYNRFAFA